MTTREKILLIPGAVAFVLFGWMALAVFLTQ